MKKIFKTWGFHNIVAHPLMQICLWIGVPKLGEWIHDSTTPEEEGGAL